MLSLLKNTFKIIDFEDFYYFNGLFVMVICFYLMGKLGTSIILWMWAAWGLIMWIQGIIHFRKKRKKKPKEVKKNENVSTVIKHSPGYTSVRRK